MTDETIQFNFNAVQIPVSEESTALRFGFHRRGHHEPVTPTPEQGAQHARAAELLAEIEANPYVRVEGYDLDFGVEPLVTERWVFDETHDEWMTRWRAWRRENPDAEPETSPLQQMVAGLFARLMERSVIADLLRKDQP